MNKHKRYPPEIRERAVRLVLEHQENYRSEWAALTSIAVHHGPEFVHVRRNTHRLRARSCRFYEQPINCYTRTMKLNREQIDHALRQV